MKKRIYIAGPLSRGDLGENLDNATAAFLALAAAGCAPLCPHWSAYCKPVTREVHVAAEVSSLGSYHVDRRPTGRVLCEATVSGNDRMSHADWISVDLPWVVAADAVLRLPGESSGADQEVSCAIDHNVPVFYSVEDVIAWAAA